MAGAIPLDVMVNLVWGSFTRGREAQRELDKLVHSAVESGATKGLKAGAKSVKSEYAQPLAKLMKAGLRDAGVELKKAYESAARRQTKAAQEVERIQKAIEKSTDDAQQRRLNREKQAAQKRMGAERSFQKELLKTAERDADRILKLRSAHEDRLSRSREQKGKEEGEKWASRIEDAFSPGNIDAKGLFQKMAGGLAGGLEKRAGAAAATKGGAASAAKLAGAASSIAAVAAPIAALIGVLSAAYGQTKDLNKAIMDSSSSADIIGKNTKAISAMGAEYGALNFRLKMLRRVTTDAAMDFRMSREEVTGYIGALNEAGVTVSEFRGIVRNATNDMEAYRDVTRTAIMASQGLGISAAESATMMNNITRDLGGGLDTIQGAFGMIFSEANKAGMSTKDFFSAINQASSGMALYNFRIGDTVGLFTDLVDILGEDLAKEKLSLEGTFENMGMQDRYKQVLLGGKQMKSAVGADAKAQGATFAESLKSAGIDLSGQGLTGKDGEFNLERLATMTGKEFRSTMRDIEGQGGDPALVRQLTSLQQLSKTTQGGMGTAQALGSLSKTGEMAALFAQGSAMSGGKTLQEMTGFQRMMMEEVTGRSGKDFDTVMRLQTSFLSEYESLVAAQDPNVMGKTFEEAMASGALTQSEKLMAASEDNYSLMERAAQDQLMETRSLTQTIQTKIVSLLENVWLGLEHLITMFASSSIFGGNTDALDQRRESMMKEGVASDVLEQLGGELVTKKGELTAAKTPEERVRIQDEIDSLEARAAQARSDIEGEKEVRKRMLGGVDANEARRGMASDNFAEKFGMSPEEFVGSKSFAARGNLGVGAQEGLTVSATQGAAYGGVTADSHITGPQVEAAVMQDLYSGKITPEDAEAMGFDVAIAPLQELTADQIETITAQAEMDRAQAAQQTKEQIDAQEETKSAIERVDSTLQTEFLANLAGASGMEFDDIRNAIQEGDSGKKDIVRVLRSRVTGEEGGLSDEQARTFAARLGVDYGANVNDFIYRGDGTSKGTINPINNADQFFGAMPGGAIDKAIQGVAGSGGGGKAPVTIHINGGDEGRIYTVVKRVLRDTGYGNVKRY